MVRKHIKEILLMVLRDNHMNKQLTFQSIDSPKMGIKRLLDEHAKNLTAVFEKVKLCE